MQFWFILSLLFSILVAVFAVLNSNVVPIKLYWIDYQLSQSLVILISAILGAMVAIFLGIFSKIKSTLKIRELNLAVKNLEEKNIELKKQMIDSNSRMSDSDIKLNQSEGQLAEQKNIDLEKNE
ncbi:MAG TPA: LapA family protein [Desulfosporosinus sp.]|nr:LapA family protein [Desulfosporosinus sp.]